MIKFVAFSSILFTWKTCTKKIPFGTITSFAASKADQNCCRWKIFFCKISTWDSKNDSRIYEIITCFCQLIILWPGKFFCWDLFQNYKSTCFLLSKVILRVQFGQTFTGLINIRSVYGIFPINRSFSLEAAKIITCTLSVKRHPYLSRRRHKERILP